MGNIHLDYVLCVPETGTELKPCAVTICTASHSTMVPPVRNVSILQYRTVIIISKISGTRSLQSQPVFTEFFIFFLVVVSKLFSQRKSYFNFLHILNKNMNIRK